MRKAFMVYGPPGAGKGTQANLLAGKFGIIHFDTGKFIEQFVHNPENLKDPKIDEYRLAFDQGKLLDPAWVYGITKSRSEQIAKSGFGIVFSGSPRTMFEAFEAENGQSGLIKVLEDLFGRENVVAIFLDVKPETSIQRNSHRLICSICGTAVMFHEHSRPEFCPVCGGTFRRRTVDVPEVIKVRLKEYTERTEPIIAGLEKRGYQIIKVDGEPMPYEVFDEVLKKLGL